MYVMEIKYVNNDFIEYLNNNTVSAVAHNCNCFHVMGTGIAEVLNQYTDGLLLKEDKTTNYGDINKLGSYSSVNVNGVRYFNLYGMYVYSSLLKSRRPQNVYVHWESLTHSLTNAIIDSEPGEICIPVMGCSNAGGSIDNFIDMVSCIVSDIGDRTTDKILTIIST